MKINIKRLHSKYPEELIKLGRWLLPEIKEWDDIEYHHLNLFFDQNNIFLNIQKLIEGDGWMYRILYPISTEEGDVRAIFNSMSHISREDALIKGLDTCFRFFNNPKFLEKMTHEEISKL